MIIKPFHLIHNTLYSSLDLIPSSTLDGKDSPIQKYALIHPEDNNSIMSAYDVVMLFSSQEEAQEELVY